MVIPGPRLLIRFPARRIPRGLSVLATCLLFAAQNPRAFVTLDTSAQPHPKSGADSAAKASTAPADSTAIVPGVTGNRPDTAAATAVPAVPVPGREAAPAAAEALPAAKAAPRSAKPHFRTALFLSSDNMLVYSHLGVLKALEEFKVEVDILVVESKDVAVGAAWALGYSMLRTEESFLAKPLSEVIRPHREHGTLVSRYTPYGPDPMQVEVPLGVQSLQSANLRWNDSPSREDDEYLHLSWMVAKLTHDAPGGPAEDLKETLRPLAVQVADLEEERGKVVLEGSLQSLLKGGLLPKDALHRRRRLWPYASGALISGHSLMADALPFTYERLIVVEPGRRLQPPALEDMPGLWLDSLEQRLKTRRIGLAQGPGVADALRIELRPDAGFDRSTRDPKAWIELGYTSALRSMDVLLATLRDGEPSPDSGRSRLPFASRARSLGLNQFTVNPLASGGRQLLQDLIRKAVADHEDSTGEEPISALVRSGYYSDLDVEWAMSPGQTAANLVFDAREKSRLLFQAGANLANSGESVSERGPEIFAGLVWSEPFYVPFRGGVSALAGGHRPGYSVTGMIAPIYPLHLELGLASRTWWIRYPAPHPRTLELGHDSISLDRERHDFFLNLYPYSRLSLGTAIQLHELKRVDNVVQIEPDGDTIIMSPAWRSMESTDFQQTARLDLGGLDVAGNAQNWIWFRYRNRNRVNLFGPVKYSATSFESRLRATLGDFRVFSQYYWSNQDREDVDHFDVAEAGEVKAFTFQDDYYFTGLKGARFQNLQAEYAPAFGRIGLRIMGGAYRLFDGPLVRPGEDFDNLYWEVQASIATAAGPFRAGLAGIQDHSPTYFLRFGADLDLDPDGAGP